MSTLTTLDDILSDLRGDLAKLTASSAMETSDDVKTSASKTVKKADYSGFHSEPDLAKAKRLISARENAIKSVKLLIAKKEQKT